MAPACSPSIVGMLRLEMFRRSTAVSMLAAARNCDTWVASIGLPSWTTLPISSISLIAKRTGRYWNRSVHTALALALGLLTSLKLSASLRHVALCSFTRAHSLRRAKKF